MDRKTADLASGALARISKALDEGEIVVFSDEEAKALREMAAVWAQLKAVISLGGTVGKGMKWFVGFVAIWIAFKAGFFQWIKTGMNP